MIVEFGKINAPFMFRFQECFHQAAFFIGLFAHGANDIELIERSIGCHMSSQIVFKLFEGTTCATIGKSAVRKIAGFTRLAMYFLRREQYRYGR